MIGGTAGVTSPGDFTDWSSCTARCGGGKQFKLRVCSEGDETCIGSTLVEQPCNTQPCEGSWGCWVEWSGCNGGRRRRDRRCEGVGQGTSECLVGSASEEMACESRVGVWAAWSGCLAGVQVRERVVQGGGQDKESRQCGELATPLHGSSSINFIVGACVLGFIIGSVVGSGLVYYYFKVKKPASVTSPHYISAKSQNLYVSLPMLDLKHKQLSSNTSDYSGTIRSNAGTLRSKTGSSIYGTKPGDYETATIKRSHSRRDSSMVSSTGGGIRADLDSDQLFT